MPPTAGVSRDQRILRRSSTLAAVGEGVLAVALPLLATNVTRDPLAVAGVVVAQHLPWVLVALGWPFVHIDRRTVIGGANTVRAVALGALGALSLVGHETILQIQLIAFIVGLGEAVTDRSEAETADGAGLSRRGMLGLAVVGLPLGGVLYEIFPATPLMFNVFAFAVAALLALFVGRAVLPATDPVAAATDGPDDRQDALGRGARPIMGAAALAAGAASAVLGILVLFALDDLGLGAPAFGLLLAGLAGAAVIGAYVAPEVGDAIGVRGGAIAALLVAGTGYAGASRVAHPDRPLVGMVALAVGAGAAMVAAILVRALLQLTSGQPVAGATLRRLHLYVWTAIPAGALVGGLIARRRGVTEVLVWASGAWVAAAVVLLLRPAPPPAPEII